MLGRNDRRLDALGRNDGGRRGIRFSRYWGRFCISRYKTVREQPQLRPFSYRRIQNRTQPGIPEVVFVSADTKPCAERRG